MSTVHYYQYCEGIPPALMVSPNSTEYPAKYYWYSSKELIIIIPCELFTVELLMLMEELNLEIYF